MREKKTKITSFIVLTVFCVFAMCILLVLLSGTGVYKRLVEREQIQYDDRTVAGYITTRVRQSDMAGSLRVEEFGGESALVFQEEIEGCVYETRIYSHEGYIKELFAAADMECAPIDGEKIFEVKKITFAQEESLLKVNICLKDGSSQVLFLRLRSGEEYDYEK